MSEDATLSNASLKKELHRFINKYFYTKEKTVDNLAFLYYLLDEFIAYTESQQVKIANEMLEKGFEKCYFENQDIKIFLDKDCGILVDHITNQEKYDLLIARNQAYINRDVLGQPKK